MQNLAIVIPAYKSEFLDQALLSIANQTCKDFTLYIGDDASPNNLQSLINKYRTEINIVYKRFDNNFGKKDLVAQWERCIDLVQNEEWIWLFSDDDMMESNCVEIFYSTISPTHNFDVYHFNVLQIDVQGVITKEFFSYPDIFSSEEFVVKKLKQPGNFSTVVEYIFNKVHFFNEGRFSKFDLAWGTDDATWIKLAQKKGIKTIPNAYIYWRESPYNISPNSWDENLVKRKLYSQIQFARLLTAEVESGKLKITLGYLKTLLQSSLFNSIKHKVQVLSFVSIAEVLSNCKTEIKGMKLTFGQTSFLYMYKIYWFFKKRLYKSKYTIKQPSRDTEMYF